MLKPVLIIASVLSLIIVSLLAVQTGYVQFNASGRPLDHIGDGIKCQLCGAGGAVAGDGYNYHCPHCGKDFRARWNDASRKIETDW